MVLHRLHSCDCTVTHTILTISSGTSRVGAFLVGSKWEATSPRLMTPAKSPRSVVTSATERPLVAGNACPLAGNACSLAVSGGERLLNHCPLRTNRERLLVIRCPWPRVNVFGPQNVNVLTPRNTSVTFYCLEIIHLLTLLTSTLQLACYFKTSPFFRYPLICITPEDVNNVNNQPPTTNNYSIITNT